MKNGLVIDKLKNLRYYLNDQLHQEDGPAVEYSDGTKMWYQYGKRHREDGPACEYANGTKEWYYQDQIIHCSSQQEFEKIIKLKAFW